MNPRFQPDNKTRPPDSVLIDPEAYDASEQEFAASLEGSSPRFVVNPDPAQVFSPPASSAAAPPPVAAPIEKMEKKEGADCEMLAGKMEPGSAVPFMEHQTDEQFQTAKEPAIPEAESDFLVPEGADSWRNEVSARLDRYRARRRPREPRYPSLRLKFDSAEPAWSAPSAGAAPSPEPQGTKAVADGATPLARPEPSIVLPGANASAADTSARVIPFRRSANAPPHPLDELAEPVLLAPRILEAPEEAPPQPALGGISIESAAEETNEKRLGIEVPVQPAAMSRRLAATAIDVVVVLAALTLFGYVFFRAGGVIPPSRQAAAIALLLVGVLWPAYQYALLVYVGATPGLSLAKLRLSRFDGRRVPKSLRRWRVLASALSGISLGLGYAWCILDEDQLCWHDRITETYMAPLD